MRRFTFCGFWSSFKENNCKSIIGEKMETYLNWSPKYVNAIKMVKSFEEIADIAISVIETLSKPVVGVTLPITSGGYGLENNLKIAEKCVLKLHSVGFSVFNILPLEFGIRPLKAGWKKKNEGYCMPILEITYRKIFESMLLEIFFSTLKYDPSSEPSFGAGWEDETLFNLNIPVLDFPSGWYEEILKDLGLTKHSEVILL